MDNQHLIPKIRFPEFKGNWVRCNLGEIAKFSKGKGISKADISNNGTLECIRYGELYTIYGETISDAISKTNLDSSNFVLSEENDVIIPASGETQIDIAKASCVLKSGIALGGDLNIIKTKNSGVFLSYYLNSKKKLEIANLAQGISVVHLYSSQLSKLNLNLPESQEQQKIASFLTSVDSKFQALKKKKVLLEQYKKGVMQKIFSQELRFKDDIGNEFPDWEQMKVCQVCEKQSSNISANRIEENSGPYLIYGASGVLKMIDFYEVQNDYVSIVKDGAGVGKLFFCNGKSSVLGTLDILKPLENTNSNFLYYMLSQIDFKKYITGSTIPHIYYKDYKEEQILLPSLNEQFKISQFIISIDNKINSIVDAITNLDKWKKGLIQQLFV